MKNGFSSIDKIPKKNSRENLAKLRPQCLQTYIICFKLMFPFYASWKQHGVLKGNIAWNGLKSYISL